VTTKKQARWTCLNCGEGGLAPTKPRRDDVRRYCLPCSAKTGRLVERVSPSLERRREAQAARTRERSKKKKARVSAQRQKVTANERLVKKRQKLINEEAQRLWKLLTPYHKGKRIPRIVITDTRQKRGASGYWIRTRILRRDNSSASAVRVRDTFTRRVLGKFYFTNYATRLVHRRTATRTTASFTTR
jgi:hypothetical protein